VTKLPPYWRPESESDIQRAIENDCLSETHYLDCKREISAKADRKETARDLASFAIDGGALLIGVDEDKGNQLFSLAPQPLDGLAERVEDIAWSTIDPGLDVTPVPIKSAHGGGLGYLFVEVRSSPFAPHAVDGAYYGRGEKRRIRLSDAQVRRYHAQQQSVEQRVALALDEEVARDPMPPESHRRGHLYLVALPLSAPAAVARKFVRTVKASELRQLVQAGEVLFGSSEMARCNPSALEASNLQRRAQGVALCSLAAAGPGRTLFHYEPGTEDQVLDVEFREDGTIRTLVGRATYSAGQADGKDTLLIFDWLIVAYAVRLAAWAAAMGRAVGYHGAWGLGLHASGLRNLPGFVGVRTYTQSPRFNEGFYQAVTTASLTDLDDNWQRVVGELVSGLLFALGTPEETFAEFVTT
jgi:hypothetical protein